MRRGRSLLLPVSKFSNAKEPRWDAAVDRRIESWGGKDMAYAQISAIANSLMGMALC